MYRLPSMPLCLRSAACASSSQAKSAKASPVGRPSGWRTKSRPSAPPVTGHSGPRKPSTSAGPAEKGSPRSRRITWSSRDKKRATSSDVPWERVGEAWESPADFIHALPNTQPHLAHRGAERQGLVGKWDMGQKPGEARNCWGHTHPLRSLQTPLLLLYIPVGTVGTAHGSQAWLASALFCSTPSPKPHLDIADTHVVLVSLQR